MDIISVNIVTDDLSPCMMYPLVTDTYSGVGAQPFLNDKILQQYGTD
jgi:hypothetical protein